MDILARAIEIASQAHAGAVDKAGAPYLLHPLRVMRALTDTAAQVAAVLHDVIEDSSFDIEALAREGFPGKIIEALQCLTKRAGEPYEDYIDRVCENEIATRVKIADLEDNMDIRRLHTLDPQALERLAKYHRAWKRLSANRDRVPGGDG